MPKTNNIPDSLAETLSSKEISSKIKPGISQKELADLDKLLMEALERESRAADVSDIGKQQYRDIVENLVAKIQSAKGKSPELGQDYSQYKEMVKGSTDFPKLSKEADILGAGSVEQDPDWLDRMIKGDKGLDQFQEELAEKQLSKRGLTKSMDIDDSSQLLRKARESMSKAGKEFYDYNAPLESWEKIGNIGKAEDVATKLVNFDVPTASLPGVESLAAPASKRAMAMKALNKILSVAGSPVSQGLIEALTPSEIGGGDVDDPAYFIENPDKIKPIGQFRKEDEENIEELEQDERTRKLREEVLKNILKPTL